MPSGRLIIGIDPSISCTGVCASLNGNLALACTVYTASGKNGFVCGVRTKTGDVYKSHVVKTVPKELGDQCRLWFIHDQMTRLINDLVVNNLQDSDLVRIGLEVPMGQFTGKTSWVFGVMTSVLERFRDRVLVLTPGQIKKFATGKGNAAKGLMVKEVFKRWNFDVDDDNLADAYAIMKFVEQEIK